MLSSSKVLYRSYRPEDYAACERLVNQAWQFDKHFSPASLSTLMKQFYTADVPLMSNFNLIAEVEGEVAGFIFGHNNLRPKKRLPFSYNLKGLFKLIKFWGLSDVSFGQKKALMSMLSCHARNRASLLEEWGSEITLFVIDARFQGMGIGSQMTEAFFSDCRDSGEHVINVEANVVEAGAFYQKVGFVYVNEFSSPLHGLCSRSDRAGLYAYQL
ncbi:GNAT family N-acetyltransferase [Thaumasiovibrio subtropicus]|uniref:GNAT family N-acetyltransferase n=1 Tax=Thaumasiovibrio subtropicus TaxID=1891207 RepID=UPI000B350D71|nr:GNAT family N-acetyltransferase [Thaumasiovibrio subtropicus]